MRLLGVPAGYLNIGRISNITAIETRSFIPTLVASSKGYPAINGVRASLTSKAGKGYRTTARKLQGRRSE